MKGIEAYGPIDSEFWFEEIAPFFVGEWTERAAVTDLRMLENEQHRPKGRPWPSRSELAKRWHWKEYRVRNMLAQEEKWKHPAVKRAPAEKLRAPRTPTHLPRPVRQVGAKSPPSDDQVETSERRQSAESSPSDRQVTAQSPPSRDPPSKTGRQQFRIHTPESVWRTLHERCPDCPPGEAELGATNRKPIARILDEHFTVEDIVLVWRWRCTSRHKRAAFLREGGFKWPTLAVKFEEYRDIAAPHRTPGPAPPLDIDALYAEARRRHPCPENATEEQRDEWYDQLHPLVAAIRAERDPHSASG